MAVAILDAGAQYSKVIDRRVRELSVDCDILPLTTSSQVLKKYAAVIISGGPQSVYGAHAPACNPDLFSLSLPILGICYGMQLMTHTLGGVVTKKNKREDGPCDITIQTDSALFAGLQPHQQVLMSHGDTVTQLPPGFRTIADSSGLIAGIENPAQKLYGVQFHPEVDLTTEGSAMLRNFLYKIVGCTGDFTLQSRLESAVAAIRKQVGKKKVLVLVSGGVDSSVCAALLLKALPSKQIVALHIDTGFMRQDESVLVVESLKKLGLSVQHIVAGERFLHSTTLIDGKRTLPLAEEVEPEHKRKIIGDTFMKIAEEVIADLQLSPDNTLLAQGTLRPDLIESASKSVSKVADTIKTHHNDTQLVRVLRDAGKVIEPLQEYHKDEVRKLGLELGLPEELVWRQPFPGPGLAIRILCATQAYAPTDLSLIQNSLQTFDTKALQTVLLPVKSVGVQGDGRTYSYAVGLRGKPDWLALREKAQEIPKKIHTINRVAYIFTSSATQKKQVPQITPTFLDTAVVEQLRQAEQIVLEVLYKEKLLQSISQFPVILLPVSFDQPGERSVVLRPFMTNDFMTGMPAIPGKDISLDALEQIVSRILTSVPGISAVLYDLTSKPPGTTEWE